MNAQIEEKVISFISRKLEVNNGEIHIGTLLVEDLDLDTVELQMEIEEEFGVHIPDEEAESLQTVGDVIDHILESLAS